MCNFFGEKKKGKEIFSVCVNNEAPKTLCSLLWHKFLQVHHNFSLCHFLSIPSKTRSPGLVKSFQQPKFSQIIYLHSFTELFHKISRCSSEQIAVILKANCNLL